VGGAAEGTKLPLDVGLCQFSLGLAHGDLWHDCALEVGNYLQIRGDEKQMQDPVRRD
jgi:hypothetical protein